MGHNRQVGCSTQMGGLGGVVRARRSVRSPSHTSSISTDGAPLRRELRCSLSPLSLASLAAAPPVSSVLIRRGRQSCVVASRESVLGFFPRLAEGKSLCCTYLRTPHLFQHVEASSKRSRSLLAGVYASALKMPSFTVPAPCTTLSTAVAVFCVLFHCCV